MDEATILAALGEIKNRQATTDSKIERLTDAIGAIAVQTQRLNTMEVSVRDLWESQASVARSLAEMSRFQASCPRDYFKERIGFVENKIADCKGKTDLISRHQQSCPRQQINWLWVMFSGLVAILIVAKLIPG
jgi:hypothetical protein